MTTLFFFFMLWLVCKALKAIFHPRAKPSHNSRQTRQNDNMAALIALQQQREQINNMISDYKYQLEYGKLELVQFEKTRNQIVSAYGKLATVESRISKLIS